MSKRDRARCKGVDCDTWVIEGMDGGLRDNRPGYCSVCSRALDMIEKMVDNKRKRPTDADDNKEHPEKKPKTSDRWEPFFAENNIAQTLIGNNEGLFEIQEALPWKKPDVYEYPCGLKFYHGPCTLCGIAMEQRKKDEAEKEKKKKDDEEAKDRLEGQRPCQGGRYREYPNGDVIIQCNCNFFCTSAIDKTRKRKVQPKLPEGQHYPYYYNCPEKDKIPSWTPWQRVEELETEEDKKKKQAATDKARMADRTATTTNTGSETTARPKSQLDLLGPLCTLIFLLVVLAKSPLMVHATITKGPMPQGNWTVWRVETVTFEFRELDFGMCDNPDRRVFTEFDSVAFEYALAAFKKSMEAWEIQVANEVDKCGLHDEHIVWELYDGEDEDPLDPYVEKIMADPVNPYIEQMTRDNQFRDWIALLNHQMRLLNKSTERVRLAAEAVIKANEDEIAFIAGQRSRLPILLYCVCVFLPLLLRADIDSDPDINRTSFLILAVQICYCVVLFPRAQQNDVGYTTIGGVYICYPVVSCVFIVLYLALWLQAVIRGGCIPRVTDVWS